MASLSNWPEALSIAEIIRRLRIVQSATAHLRDVLPPDNAHNATLRLADAARYAKTPVGWLRDAIRPDAPPERFQKRWQAPLSELLKGWDDGSFAKVRIGDTWVIQRRYGGDAPLASLDAAAGPQAHAGRTRPLTLGIDLTAVGPRLKVK